MSDYDVVVVGSGGAGLSAALTASAAGASVLVVESEDVIGGASSWSPAGMLMGAGTRLQQAAGIDDNPDALFRHYMTINHWDVDPAVVRRLTGEAGATIDWLEEIGVEFLPDIYFSGDEDVPRGHTSAGQAKAIVAAVYAEAHRRPNIEFALKRRVDRLIVENDRVAGVAVGPDEVRANAVVLATGGFGANRELIDRYYPSTGASGDWVFYVGPESSRGDVFALGAQVDAQIAGFDRGCTNLRPSFSREPVGYLVGWIVLVNGLGRRFMDEMAPYSVTEPLVKAQPGPVYALFDQASKEAAQPKTSFAHLKVDLAGHTWEDWVEPLIDEMLAAGKIVKADTLPELAVKIGVPAENLAATAERYNESARLGSDRDFLKKASELRPISTPPFYASEVRMCSIGLTSTGVRIDEDARVIANSGRPVAGLFAAGECTGGVLGPVYVGSGNSMANAYTMGRVAGRTAAAEVLRQAAPAQPA